MHFVYCEISIPVKGTASFWLKHGRPGMISRVYSGNRTKNRLTINTETTL